MTSILPAWLSGHRFDPGHEFDRKHATVVVRTLAACRLALAAVALLAVAADPPHAPLLPPSTLLAPLLVAFLAFSAAVVVAAAARPDLTFRFWIVLHLLDLTWIIALTIVSDGASSPFVGFFVYAMLAAGYRAGLPATLATGAFAIAALVTEALVNLVWPFARPTHLQTAVTFVASTGVPAVLIGLMAEEEWRQRSRARVVASIMSRVRVDAGLVAAVRAVFDGVLAELKADRGVLAIEEEGSSNVFLWHVRRPAPGALLDVRLTQQQKAACGTYLFPLPPAVDVLRARRASDSGPLDVDMFDEDGARTTGDATAVLPLQSERLPWRTALCVPRLAGEVWHGRLFVFDPARASQHDVRFLQVAVRQVAPALFNLYLQRRLHSRGGVVDRLRISRELHDGVIQSLIGLEMELEVLRREIQPSLPDATGRRLSTIQTVLRREILSVRDLMQSLQPVDVEPHHLLEHLGETLESFRQKSGIQARLLTTVDRVDLPRRVCNELSRIVDEALANVRKHSGASNVVVAVEHGNGGWRLTVDDDGKGFDFEGRLTDAMLEAERRGPVILKERLKAIGGSLVIDSRPGHGARLEMTIPR